MGKAEESRGGEGLSSFTRSWLRLGLGAKKEKKTKQKTKKKRKKKRKSIIAGSSSFLFP